LEPQGEEIERREGEEEEKDGGGDDDYRLKLELIDAVCSVSTIIIVMATLF